MHWCFWYPRSRAKPSQMESNHVRLDESAPSNTDARDSRVQQSSASIVSPTVDLQADTAARCHEIQVCLGNTDVPDFESVLEIGMAVRLALHLRGLPLL